MDHKTNEAIEMISRAVDAVQCDGPSRRALEAALAHIRALVAPKSE